MGKENDAVLEEVRKEIKGFGDDAKKLVDSLTKDHEDLKKRFDEAEKKGHAVHPEVKDMLDKMSSSVAEKQKAVEESVKKVQEQTDALETAIKRSALGKGEDGQKEFKTAEDFMRVKMARDGTLRGGTILTSDQVNLEAFKAFERHFGVYLRRDEKGLSQDELKALSVGSDPDGGYVVTPQVSSRVTTKIFETSPIRQVANVETISTDALEIPYDEDEATVGWVGETEDRGETGTPQRGVARIPVHELYAKPRATQKLLDDAGINIEEWLANKVSDKFGRTENTSFVTGNGVNKPRGFLTYAATSDYKTPERGKIMQVPLGDATAIKADGLIRMLYNLKAEYMANGSWMAKRSTVLEIMLLKDGNGQYLWRPGLQAGQPGLLLNHAIRMADDMPQVEAGALAIAFGDWRRGYTIVDRMGIRTLRDPFSAKPFVEFYSTKRVGGDVVNFEAFCLGKVAVP